MGTVILSDKVEEKLTRDNEHLLEQLLLKNLNIDSE
jgi:hypothetical protein